MLSRGLTIAAGLLLYAAASARAGQAIGSMPIPATAQDTKLEAIFADILADLRHQYVLAYPAPENGRNGEWHAIRVAIPGRDYAVRARLGYRLARRNPQ